MAKLHFELVAPERLLASDDVDQVDVPGVEGVFGVLANHAPLMTVLAPGVVRVKNGADETRIFVRGGFAEVTPLGLTILAEEAVPVKELDRAQIEKRIKNAEQDLADADSPDERKVRAERELRELRDLAAAL
ncbi:MAG: F0F1 ATP synthase subunit epsilon [Parvularculaceae bacterium]|jgi:F-type H+-transporting ATPase subunit epsilon|nr:F0F1 ATP synthase subunit epsilon [Parvularculaceae bacterium]